MLVVAAVVVVVVRVVDARALPGLSSLYFLAAVVFPQVKVLKMSQLELPITDHWCSTLKKSGKQLIIALMRLMLRNVRRYNHAIFKLLARK